MSGSDPWRGLKGEGGVVGRARKGHEEELGVWPFKWEGGGELWGLLIVTGVQRGGWGV